MEKDGEIQTIPCDTVVLSMRLQSENTLVKELEDRVPVLVIGDCRSPRHIAEAILEARQSVQHLSGESLK